jgi:acetate kinase
MERVSAKFLYGGSAVERGPNVLALNSGSSSVKFGVYRGPSPTALLISGEAAWSGDGQGSFSAHDSHQRTLLDETITADRQREVMPRIAKLLADCSLSPPAAIGHRVVHGGPTLRQHCVIDETVMRQLETAAVFAPLHTPPTLSLIRDAQEHFPGLPHVACLDTAFHAEMPAMARCLPIGKALQGEGIERYGFHGLSCASIVSQLLHDPPDAPWERLIIAHLGNGASITAVKNGKSVDTSMGLTPTGGVIMGTRSGDLDPGVLIYLLREKKFDAAMLEDLVNHRAGLLGISGVDSDMRRLRELAPSNADARLAVAMFCYSVSKQIAGMIAALNGVDLLVFTGGIGEHDEKVRAAVCRDLFWIGIRLDEAQNRSSKNPINNLASRCAVRVLAAREGEEIARHTWALLQRA